MLAQTAFSARFRTERSQAHGFTRHDAEVTAGGLLMFGKVDAIRRFLPTHEAAFQVLRGLHVEVNDFMPHPLLRVLRLADVYTPWGGCRSACIRPAAWETARASKAAA